MLDVATILFVLMVYVIFVTQNLLLVCDGDQVPYLSRILEWQNCSESLELGDEVTHAAWEFGEDERIHFKMCI